MSNAKILKPMTFWSSLLYFGIPSMVITIFIYYLWPYLNKIETPAIISFTLIMYVPLASLLIAALLAFLMEGNKLSWANLTNRFRLNPMKKREWLWTIGLTLFIIISYGGLSFTAKWLVSIPLFSPPDFLPPIIDPRVDQTIIPKEFMEILLEGQWWIVFGYLGGLFFNIFGEEFWWRGYILPRQEVVMGKYTWFIHGILWTLFHVFWKWNLIMLLPVCLSISFVASKLKNTWPAIIAHFVLNGMGIIPLILGVLGSNS
ncbi:MAG: CPBP family intramembrane metalloprotease [Methanosarcinaceae archaeon]|nr:CPBP family intramembrane metalloprotease [Methanosarcinaceae archaeon]